MLTSWSPLLWRLKTFSTISISFFRVLFPCCNLDRYLSELCGYSRAGGLSQREKTLRTSAEKLCSSDADRQIRLVTRGRIYTDRSRIHSALSCPFGALKLTVRSGGRKICDCSRDVSSRTVEGERQYTNPLKICRTPSNPFCRLCGRIMMRIALRSFENSSRIISQASR